MEAQMAQGIYKLPSGKYRAHVHRKGHKQITRAFAYEADAIRWKKEQDRSIDLTGLPLTIDELKNKTVGDLVRRYLVEITPTKATHIRETFTLNKFLKQDMCRMSLAFAGKLREAAIQYRNFRLYKDSFQGRPILPSSVSREFVILRNVFNVARNEWDGYSHLSNPFSRIEIKGSKGKRKRKIASWELNSIEFIGFQALKGLNRIYIPLAFSLARETGMGLQEIFNLAWEDVDLGSRRIEIRKSKTDYKKEYPGRTIVLSVLGTFYLSRLANSIGNDRRRGYIFPRTDSQSDPKGAFKQSWADVVRRAFDVKTVREANIQFRDIRHLAASRFHNAGLTGQEQQLMMGHDKGDMTSLYIEPELQIIQDKLDRYDLRGRSLEEVWKEANDKAPTPDEALHNFECLLRGGAVLSKQETREWVEWLRNKDNKDVKGDVIPFLRTATL
jgi:integrase